MDPTSVKAKLIEILETIQCDQGYAPVPITGTTCPFNDLQGFDTKVSPVAVSYLASATGIAIPNGNNIFVSSHGQKKLTVDEIAVEVCKLAPASR